MAELINIRLTVDCNLQNFNQVYKLEKPIKLALYNAIKCGEKNPCYIRPFGVLIGAAEAIITVAIRLAMIVEDLFKGIADIIGSLFCIEKCRLLRGLFQLILIPKEIVYLPFSILYGILELVRSTLRLAFGPQSYIQARLKDLAPSKVVRNLNKDFDNIQEEVIDVEVHSQQVLKEKFKEFFSLLGENNLEEASNIIWTYFKEERDPFLYALAIKQMENSDTTVLNTIKNMSDSSQWAYLPLCIIGKFLIEQNIVEPIIEIAKSKLPEEHLLYFSLCFEIAYPQHKTTLREKIVINGENGVLLTQLREQEEGAREAVLENHKKIEESTKKLFEEFFNNKFD